MNLIITMAGRYVRFIEEGYKIPKFLLPWGVRSILHEILWELTRGGAFDAVYLVANKRDEIYMPHVRRILSDLRIPKENLFLVGDTSGQAETAKVGVEKAKMLKGELSGPVVFHNIDTVLYGRDLSGLPLLLKENMGYIDIIRASHHDYSYVLANERGQVEAIVEKVVISEQATSGLYAFGDVHHFLDYYNSDEHYLSDVYQKMINDGQSVRVGDLYTEKETIVLGTPLEYLSAMHTLDL